MTTPRIEAIALVGSRNQRIYMATRAGAVHDKQQKQQSGGTSDGDMTTSGPSNALTTVRMHDEVLRLEYAAHCALDIVEERSQTKGANGEVVPSAATYLGLVLTMEDLAIYAMTTSTKLRILLVLCPGEARMRDIDCVTILRAIHTSYLSYISNPCLVLPASQGDPNEGARLSTGQANAQIKVEGSPVFDRRIAAIGGWA